MKLDPYYTYIQFDTEKDGFNETILNIIGQTLAMMIFKGYSMEDIPPVPGKYRVTMTMEEIKSE
jgi:hypothetical protein